MNRKINNLALALTLLFAVQQVASAQTAPPDQQSLKFVLVLTRHGVRSPTWTNERLDEYAKQPWPQWPVAPGILTPHGRQLMTLFGAYYRAWFAERNLPQRNRLRRRRQGLPLGGHRPAHPRDRRRPGRRPHARLPARSPRP